MNPRQSGSYLKKKKKKTNTANIQKKSNLYKILSWVTVQNYSKSEEIFDEFDHLAV